MTEVIEFVDWGDDFRYAEERRRVTETIRSLATEHGGFSHGIVQYVCPSCPAVASILISLHGNVDQESIPDHVWLALNRSPEEARLGGPKN